MSRRRLLGVAGSAIVAGCIADAPETGSESPPANESDGTTPPAGSRTGGDAPESCLAYGDRVERVICYDGVDPDDEPIVLEPSATSVERGDDVAFELENGTDATLDTNFYAWTLRKYVDGEWFHVAPAGHEDPLMTLDPGESHAWTVTLTEGGVREGESIRRTSATDDVTVPGVGGGWYAFGTSGWFEGGSYEEKTAFAATFELDGDPIELVPTSAIEETTREDGTLVARSSRGDPDDERYRLGAYELDRVADPDGETRRVIAEQVVGDDRLRDALALSIREDADRVRLEEFDATTPMFGGRSDGTYEFRGEYYEVTTRELEG